MLFMLFWLIPGYRLPAFSGRKLLTACACSFFRLDREKPFYKCLIIKRDVLRYIYSLNHQEVIL